MNLEKNHESVGVLVCPVTKLDLELVTLETAEERVKGKLISRVDSLNAKGKVSKPAGPTPLVLLRKDLKCAYPVVDGIAVLLAPEALSTTEDQKMFDLTDPRYAEAYEEMEFYNSVASAASEKLNAGGAVSILPTELAATKEERDSFPAPWSRWVDTVHDSASLWDAYVHLGALKNGKVLQLGGSGTHVIKFAFAGAAESWLITPMLGEALMARGLAESAGVGGQFRCVVAIAEELPIRSGNFDAVFAGGCLHHMQTDLALPEAARVLREGGRFAAVEPWRAPLYAIGTKLLGQREDAYCRPLTPERIKPLKEAFKKSHVLQHGTITRYGFLALEKFGINVSKYIPWYVGKVDDAICSIIPGLRGMGSSIAVLADK